MKVDELKGHMDQIRALCDKNKVRSLFKFGSITSGKSSPEKHTNNSPKYE